MLSTLLLGITLAAADDTTPSLSTIPYCHTGAYGTAPKAMLAALHSEHSLCRKRLSKAYAQAPRPSLPVSVRRSVR